jgi:hypothetical protein
MECAAGKDALEKAIRIAAAERAREDQTSRLSGPASTSGLLASMLFPGLWIMDATSMSLYWVARPQKPSQKHQRRDDDPRKQGPANLNSWGAIMHPPQFLKKLCYGQYSLVATFWGFYVGGYVLVVSACWAIFYLSGGAQPIGMFTFFAQTLYLFVASVGVWISAGRAQSRVGARAARAWILLFGLTVIHNVYRHLPELLNNLTAQSPAPHM